MLDAPVSGGVTGAEQATLCIMVGGDRSVYTSYKPVLDLIGEKVLYCGEQGMGAVCKIVNNLINLGNYVLVSEALTLGLKAGAKTETMFEAISHSSGNTECMQEFPASLFQGNFEPGFKLDLGAKDVGLATEMGRHCACRWNSPTSSNSVSPKREIEAGDSLRQSRWRNFKKSGQV